MKDGMIELDSERGKLLGFTSDKYEGYLWKKGSNIVISFIVSHKRGNYRELVRRIHEQGWTVQVPTPLGRMQYIVAKNGYQHSREPFGDDIDELVDIWSLPPAQKQA